VPLSEHEQRLLDQIERALYQDDPKFASTVRSSDLRTHMKRRLRRAAVILVIGFALLLAGVVTHPVVGVAGFVVMLGALLLALSSWKRLGSASSPQLRAVGADGRPGKARRAGKARPAKDRKTGGSLLGRLEERWNRRWDERGRD
jgi:hypothetical protein